MQIVKNGYIHNNITNVLTENEILYLKELTKLFPLVENNKEAILRGRLSTNKYENKSEDDTYSYQKMNEVYEYLVSNNLHFSQKWCFVSESELFKEADIEMSKLSELNSFFKKISIKILNNAYIDFSFEESDIRSDGGLTYYEDGDFIEMHADGVNETRLCVILLYLNDGWKEGDGGQLVLQNDNDVILERVAPIFGDYVILDFTQNNLRHAVTKIKNGFKRFTYAHFVEMRENVESQNWNKFIEIKTIK